MMSEVDELIEQIDRQLQRYGIEPIRDEIARSRTEVQKVYDGVRTSFAQDFRYHNVEKCLVLLRGVLHNLDTSKTFIGEYEMVLGNVKNRIRTI
jgi:hypothetical protein